MKKILFYFVMLLVFTTNAQTVVSHLNLHVKDSVFQANDTLFEINLSTIGGDQTWDFSSLQQHLLDTIVPIDPENTNHSDDFPNANLAYGVEDSANYQINDNNAWLNLGFGGYNSRIGADILSKYERADTIISFPIEYKTDSVKRYGFGISYFTVNGNDVKKKTSILRTQIANAWGKAITPINTYDVIRVFENYKRIDSIWVYQSDEWKFRRERIKRLSYYHFWTNETTVKYPLLSVLYDPSQDTVINTKWVVKSVGENEDVNTQIQIRSSSAFSVYPNPAKNNITIRTGEDIQDISIFTLNGVKLISTNNKQVNIENLSSGIYLIKVQTTTNNYLQKILIK